MSKKPNLADLQQQIADLTDALQRERADVINVRRRHDEQITSLKTLVKANVVRDLLPVIDNFERALKHKPADSKIDEWIKGVMSIKSQFDQTFDAIGVQRIKTVGEVFDPRVHEAVSMDEGDGDGLPAGRQVEVVCEELQPGYAVGNDIIRHAMVRVRMEPEAKNSHVKTGEK